MTLPRDPIDVQKPGLDWSGEGGDLPRPPKDTLFSKKEIGERIRSLRLQRGLPQVELARLLSVHQTNISAMERGARALTIHQILKLSRVLKVSTDEILTGAKARENGHHLDRRFLRRLEKIDRLSKRDKQSLLGTIDAFLSKVS
jgi:transcriptional regulator with XRE-family HTH domain